MPPIEVDKGRIVRALEHSVTRVGPGQYRVATQSAIEDRDYYFYVQTGPNLICYCSDAAYRAPVCKHVLAALIHDHDPRIKPYQALIDTERAQQAMTKVASPPAAETEYPDALTLDQALSRMNGPEMGRSRRLAGRILTDPAADLGALRLVAERCPKLHIRTALLRIPEAASDPAIRRSIVEDEPTPHIIALLLPTAHDDEEFRLLFRKLLEAKALKAARRVIDEQSARAHATLRPSDLTGFFESEKREDREYGMELLSRLQRDVTRAENVSSRKVAGR